VKVTTENGPIRTGDLLVAASTPGHAMRWNPDGENVISAPTSTFAVIGNALEDFDGSPSTDSTGSPQAGSGTILVFVNLEHQRLTATDLGGQIAVIEDSASLTGFAVKFHANAIFAAKLIASSGNWELDETGRLVIKELETEKIKIASDNSPAGRQGTVGFGRIRSNDDKVDIANSNVTDKSLIFVTFMSDLAGKSYYISQKVAGAYFTVKLSSLAITDLDFQYWIVDSDLDYQAFVENLEQSRKVDQQSGVSSAPAPALEPPVPEEPPTLAPEPEPTPEITTTPPIEPEPVTVAEPPTEPVAEPEQIEPIAEQDQ